MSPPNESALTLVAGTLARRVGWRIDPKEQGRLARCVAAAAAARDLEVRDYVAQLESDPIALQDLLDRVTVQETAFFRDRSQFDALAESVLPGLAAPVTVWSAACSNGQEAYSVAMVLAELGHAGSRVIATDISTKAIGRTRRGWYSNAELKGVSQVRRDRFLTSADGGFEIVPELRARVDVGHLNLATDPPPFAAGSNAVVLCRNVLIYFSPAEIVRFIERLADWIAPGSWLFLGYSESLRHVSERFELVRVGDAFLYRCVASRGTNRAPAPNRAPKRQLPKRDVPTQRPRRTVIAEVAPVDVATLPAIGAAAGQSGDHAAAVTAFRKHAYLNPNQPIAHLHLGLALEASGDVSAACRAYAAARNALDRSDAAMVEETLEGYGVDELARLLDMKLESSS
jgi:chemotaxis methyl-accepting protein methylase